MPVLRPLRALALTGLAVGALALPAAASAQSVADPAPATTTTATAEGQASAALRHEARRLTLLARVPSELRDQVAALWDRADALRARAETVRTQALQAYVDALKQGADPAVARVQAGTQTADARLALAQDGAALRADVEAFLATHPEARAWVPLGPDAGRAPGSAGTAGALGARDRARGGWGPGAAERPTRP